MSTLAISRLTTSNLPWFLDLTFQVPMQYCSLQHQTSIASHIHNWVLFLLWLHLFILSGIISPLFSSRILGTYTPGEFIFLPHYAFLKVWLLRCGRCKQGIKIPDGNFSLPRSSNLGESHFPSEQKKDILKV